MKSLAPVLLGILLAALPARGAAPRKGTILSVEVTSLTRKAAHLFVRTSLPGAARGANQTFRGEASAWGVVIPLKHPVRVAVQPAGQEWAAVFLVDVELPALPKALLEKGSAAALPVTLKGTLSGEAGTAATVDAAGALRPGTADLVAHRELVDAFVGFAGARISGLGFTETRGEARIAVFNPFLFDVALRGARYELSSDGGAIARGSRQGLIVRPGKSEIVLPLTVSNAAALAAAGRAVASGGTLSGRLDGELVLKLGAGDVKVPLAAAGKVEVLQ